MSDLVESLNELANNQSGLLVLAGIIFLGLGVLGKIEGKINLGKEGRIISSVVGGFLLAIGLLLSQLSSSTVQKSGLSPVPTVLPTSPSQAPTNPATTSSSQAQYIGWIRLGAVKSRSGSASVGEALVATTQGVTIIPTQVPALNAQVTILAAVNVRNDCPKPPDYELPEKITSLQPNQKIVILETRTFVDQKSLPDYTIVWAKVGLL